MTEEEIVRLRSYLAAQSMKRTPAQIIRALEEAYQQFVTAILLFPDQAYSTPIDEHTWSASQVVEHVDLFLESYTTAICSVLEKGQHPPDFQDRQELIPSGRIVETREEVFSHLEELLKRLTSTVLQADPYAHLAITWKHFELGEMHWREWLLFARVHLLDHIRQVNQEPMLAE